MGNASMLFAQAVKNLKEPNAISATKAISCLKLVSAHSVSLNTMPAWTVKTIRFAKNAKKDLL